MTSLPAGRPDLPLRRWRLRPPPPIRPLVESDGMGLLLESPDALTHLLWRSLRTVLDWAETPPAQRPDLFAEGAYESRLAALLAAEIPAELVDALEGLAAVLSRVAPPAGVLVAGHCATVSGWAHAAGRPAASLAFAEAAALCCPLNAVLALRAGRLARDQARYAVAEGWLQRAVTLARQTEDWDTYARAHIAFGNMMVARGAFPAARRHLLRAERRAARHSLADVRGMALHDLFVVETNCGNFAPALALARQALSAYPPGDARLVSLIFDLAFFWMHQGYFQTALPVFRSLLPRVPPRFLPHIHGAIARAAALCGEPAEHRRSIRVLAQLPVGPGTAEAWLDAAHGAVSLARWDEAARCTERALELAEQRGEQKIAYLASELRPFIQQRRRPAPSVVQTTEETAAHEVALDAMETLARVPVGGSAA